MIANTANTHFAREPKALPLSSVCSGIVTLTAAMKCFIVNLLAVEIGKEP
jgi:hypothetical protein